MIEDTILEEVYKEAQIIFKKNRLDNVDATLKKDIDLLIDKIEGNKSLVSALATSLLKKIIDPKQDIRLPRADFENGYSGRSLDTRITSPFFKKYFPKYANKETSFLTLSTRERIKWTIDDGNNLKIRNINLKKCFLDVFDQIETHNKNPRNCLCYLFAKLIELTNKEDLIFQIVKKTNTEIGTLNINTILTMLKEHFSIKLSSRLPVIAIYSIYEILIPLLKRYDKKKLIPLQVHTSSDKHSFGDIEVYDEKNLPFEIVEIKHNIPIDKNVVFDIIKKIKGISINRYYILTTYARGFENQETEQLVNEFIAYINTKINIDIIANGIITTLKYYLRFIDDYNLFLNIYTKNLIIDARRSTEIKSFHIEKWIEIKNKYSLKK